MSLDSFTTFTPRYPAYSGGATSKQNAMGETSQTCCLLPRLFRRGHIEARTSRRRENRFERCYPAYSGGATSKRTCFIRRDSAFTRYPAYSGGATSKHIVGYFGFHRLAQLPRLFRRGHIEAGDALSYGG